MKWTKKNKKGLTRGEKLLYTLAILSLIGTFGVKVFIGATTSNMKMELEELTVKLDKQQNKNDSLAMQVNELTSYENLNTVLQDMGLAYNDENIIILAYYLNKIIVGYILIRRTDNNICLLDGLYVEKEYRNKGIGKSLLVEYEIKMRKSI